MPQHTLAKTVTIRGIGLHSGVESTLTLNPAPANSGIVFVRSDLPERPRFKALYSAVTDTRNCTCLGNAKGQVVSTVEHLMAALNISRIDNALIEVSNAELPIMDGSALPFWKALQEARTLVQDAPRKVLRVLRPIRFEDGKGASVELAPAAKFSLSFDIEFPSKVVGHQKFSGVVTPEVFASKIAPCRTFCEKYQVDYLKSVGLIKGGSLDNAVVLDGDAILNEGGFRVANECVNHKVIDALGDLYTAGMPVLGSFRASKSGHFHNNELLKRLFADTADYEIIEE